MHVFAFAVAQLFTLQHFYLILLQTCSLVLLKVVSALLIVTNTDLCKLVSSLSSQEGISNRNLAQVCDLIVSLSLHPFGLSSILLSPAARAFLGGVCDQQSEHLCVCV